MHLPAHDGAVVVEPVFDLRERVQIILADHERIVDRPLEVSVTVGSEVTHLVGNEVGRDHAVLGLELDAEVAAAASLSSDGAKIDVPVTSQRVFVHDRQEAEPPLSNTELGAGGEQNRARPAGRVFATAQPSIRLIGSARRTPRAYEVAVGREESVQVLEPYVEVHFHIVIDQKDELGESLLNQLPNVVDQRNQRPNVWASPSPRRTSGSRARS